MLGIIVGPTRYIEKTSGEERFTLDLLDLDAFDAPLSRIPLSFFGHGLAINPKRPREAVLFGKRSLGACVVDLEDRREVRPVAPMSGHAFYGHGAYSGEGDVIFVVEAQLKTNQGVISIRDSRTFEVLGVFPTYGMAPHDCHLIEDGRTLVIANGGGPVDSSFLPSVTFVDVATRTLLETHEVVDRNRNCGHIALRDKREFAMVSAPRNGLPEKTALGGVTLRTQGRPWGHMMAPNIVTSRLVGESLSVAIHGPSGTVVATHPDCGLITFWSLDCGRLISRLELPGPRGVAVTVDQQLYAISYGTEARLLLIQANPFQVLPDQRFEPGIFGGAHLCTWNH